MTDSIPTETQTMAGAPEAGQRGEPAEAASSSLDPGRLIIPALRAGPDASFGAEAGRIADGLDLGVGGFILFGGTAESVRRLTSDLFRRAGRPLLIASDLERGAGQQVDGLTQFPPPLALASLGDAAVVRWAGAVTAQEARAVGINWVFAPVADLDVLPDNPIVQTRAFGDDPDRVASLVRTWIEGCQGAGALACAKHFPGHGRTAVDSHIALPVVADSAERLRQTDLLPFAIAVEAGVASIMTAHVAYPALDPEGIPATLSAPILAELRGTMGYDGLVVSDALIMDGALVGRRESDAAVEAIRAGVDLLLYPNDARRVRDALSQAMASGALESARLAEALRRYDRALVSATRATPPVTRGPYDSAEALADALLEQGMLRGAAPRLRGPIDLLVVDDDLGGPYPPGPTDGAARVLGPERMGRYAGGSRVVLAFAEPRAWKGRSGFSPESRDALANALSDAELVVLFGHPRLLPELPTDRPVLLAWHRQRLMQEAVGRWLRRRVE
ncbi:MAG TPA: glycoside hydrolase family 3 N-terminal domain-containing protein [Gemmatimonadales bacterium]|nr:glycoside hydrolase family 3 N-terminal domain-containing protein [Gemmatimonadales bacterium]